MRKLFTFLALLALSSGPAAAGVVYEIEVKDHRQSPPESETIQAAVEGRHLKMGIASGGRGSQGEMIFRGDRREMVVVDHDKGTYQVMDEEMIRGIAGQLGDANRMMQEALKNVPEDQRAVVEQMMKQKMPGAAAKPPARPKSELKKTGERADKNGYPCVKYEVLVEGRKVRELWSTDWDNVEGGSDVVDAFEDMAGFFREMMDALPDFGQGRGMGDPAFENMKELGGFPVVTREFDQDGSLQGETALRSAKRQTIDPDAFEPPSGYKRQEMFRGR
ncbi:MAG: hypothetical protein GY769_08270 [bacterium]|nr:hypothetical protein [bacterium]